MNRTLWRRRWRGEPATRNTSWWSLEHSLTRRWQPSTRRVRMQLPLLPKRQRTTPRRCGPPSTTQWRAPLPLRRPPGSRLRMWQPRRWRRRGGPSPRITASAWTPLPPPPPTSSPLSRPLPQQARQRVTVISLRCRRRQRSAQNASLRLRRRQRRSAVKFLRRGPTSCISARRLWQRLQGWMRRTPGRLLRSTRGGGRRPLRRRSGWRRARRSTRRRSGRWGCVQLPTGNAYRGPLALRGRYWTTPTRPWRATTENCEPDSMRARAVRTTYAPSPGSSRTCGCWRARARGLNRRPSSSRCGWRIATPTTPSLVVAAA
mmetsp:Transcript_27905/g.70094  ORF Transcript_27905/g.70094 Transcript_27905/m.70094 type:complete len:317 (+) Transcript_27905:1697-2647(+)